ncbi:MD-2-related lipid-recognition protein-like isoform X3 [Anopheles funestus]
MKCFRMVVSVVLLALCLHLASGEVVNFQKCPGEEKCTIHEVSYRPCPEAAEGNPCLVYRGTNVSITFDFTPNFNANELTADVSWTRPLYDLPYVDMDTTACKHTNCPVVSGNRQTYTYAMPIKKGYFLQDYDIKWKLASENGDACCFIIKIKIVKKKRRT